MISRDYLPSEPLRSYIKQYRFRHFFFPKEVGISFKPFPPRPEQCIVFYPRGYEIIEQTLNPAKQQRPRSVISGQFTQRINRYLCVPEFLMIEVDLQPGALNRLTGIPFKELVNKDLDAESVFGNDIRKVNERLSSTGSYDEMMTVIENFFYLLVEKQKKEFIPVDDVMIKVAANSQNFSVDALSRMSYLSPRQMERKFEERIGISPRTFLRICRFNQSYWLHLENPNRDWFSIAIHSGYTDYQHMVKDYKDFANSTPVQFFAEESQAPGRILGLTK